MANYRSGLVLFVLVLLTGCGTLPNGRLWGERATLHPGWQRIKAAARASALAPQTWAPLAGAALFRATDWDKKVSEWAIDHHPLFGSQSGAHRGSDTLVYTTAALYGMTVLAAPGGEQPKPWLKAKFKGGVVGSAAVGTAMGVTLGLKELNLRTRPDRSDNQSFPSGHTTGAAALATLTSRNLNVLPLTQGERIAARIGLGGLVVATGWARLEEGKHYPSDVLVGAAVGYYFSSFINDAFLGCADEAPFRTTLDLSRQGAVVGLIWEY